MCVKKKKKRVAGFKKTHEIIKMQTDKNVEMTQVYIKGVVSLLRKYFKLYQNLFHIISIKYNLKYADRKKSTKSDVKCI